MGRLFIMRSWLSTCWLLMLIYCCPAGAQQQTGAGLASDHLQPLKRVFILCSFNYGYSWTDRTLSGITQGFAHSGLTIEPYVACMDMKRIPESEEYVQQLKQTYQTGYRGVSFDAVIACDNDALNFIRRFRDELFPGVPVVFSSIADFSRSMLDDRSDITGTAENTDYATTLLMILELLPAVKKIVVVVDNTTSGQAHRSALDKVKERIAVRVDFQYLSLADYSLEEMGAVLQGLDDTCAVLLLQHFRDKNGVTYPVETSTSFLTGHCRVPSFVLTDSRMGLGGLGGHVVSGYYHGEAAAEMVTSILKGVDIKTIPVKLHSPNKYVFDYNQLQRFGISEKRLPAGSIVVNRPESIVVKYRQLLVISGSVLGVVSLFLVLMVFEILRRRKVEKALRQEQTLLSSIVETSPVGITMVDASGTISFANSKAVAILGLTPSTAIGQVYNAPQFHITALDGTPFPDQELPFVKVMTTAQVVFDIRHAIVQPDGRTLFLSVSGAPMHNEQGEVNGMVASFEDITESVRADMERLRLEEQMDQKRRLESLGFLAGGIAHDFNNLMGGVFGYVDLAREISTDNEVKDNLAKAVDTMDRARTLTRQMLTFAQGGAPLRQIMPIFPFVKECAQTVVNGTPCRITTEVPADLPPCNMDRNQIGQVIMNIVLNALEAMNGAGCVHITATLDTVGTHAPGTLVPGRYIRLLFKDTGCGIAPEIIPHIFDPFFTTKAKGHGLGLATAYSIVKRHEGCIAVESVVGVGSEFVVYLPAAVARG